MDVVGVDDIFYKTKASDFCPWCLLVLRLHSSPCCFCPLGKREREQTQLLGKAVGCNWFISRSVWGQKDLTVFLTLLCWEGDSGYLINNIVLSAKIGLLYIIPSKYQSSCYHPNKGSEWLTDLPNVTELCERLELEFISVWPQNLVVYWEEAIWPMKALASLLEWHFRADVGPPDFVGSGGDSPQFLSWRCGLARFLWIGNFGIINNIDEISAVDLERWREASSRCFKWKELADMIEDKQWMVRRNKTDANRFQGKIMPMQKPNACSE